MAELTGSPRTIYLYDEQGKEHEYLVYPLNDADITALDHWLRDSYIRMVRSSLEADSVSEKAYETEMNLAHARASGLTWLSGEGAKKMATVDGMARILWQALHDPDADFEKLRKLMFLKKNIAEGNKTFRELNMSNKSRGSSGSPGKSKRKSQRKKHKKRKRKSTRR